MIKDPKVGDVVKLLPNCFHKHLQKDTWYAITALEGQTWGGRCSLTTVEQIRNPHGRKTHLGSWSGVYVNTLERHEFLTAVYTAKKEKNAARTEETTTATTPDA